MSPIPHPSPLGYSANNLKVSFLHVKLRLGPAGNGMGTVELKSSSIALTCKVNGRSRSNYEVSSHLTPSTGKQSLKRKLQVWICLRRCRHEWWRHFGSSGGSLSPPFFPIFPTRRMRETQFPYLSFSNSAVPNELQEGFYLSNPLRGNDGGGGAMGAHSSMCSFFFVFAARLMGCLLHDG